MLYADARRIGDHGIGRFARCVLEAIDYSPISLSSDPDSPLDPLKLMWSLRHLRPGDLFFSPGYNPPLRSPVPFLFTLHDLNHLDREENSSALKKLYYATVVQNACRAAARVLTVSEFSRQRILDSFSVSPEKVVNVYNGVGDNYSYEGAKYQLESPYLLCVSNRRKHKNEFRIVEAFAKSNLSSSMKFVFTGNPTDELADWIEKQQVSGSVVFIGNVPEPQLPSLYRGASALVFPSLYEGFGLPVLEAMACGTPVVTSNTTSLPEIAGDATLLVDPISVEQISEAMKRITTDRYLREALRDKGIRRSALFTWDKTIHRVKDVLESCNTNRR